MKLIRSLVRLGRLRNLLLCFDQDKFNSHICFQEEKRGLQDRLAQQQRVLSQIEQEKREVELTSLRIEKDRKTVKAALDKVKYCVIQLVPTFMIISEVVAP